MKLIEVLKESWRLTKSNMVMMIMLMSVGLFLSCLIITPFIQEVTGFPLRDGLGQIVLFVFNSLFSSVMVQFTILAFRGESVQDVRKVLLLKNLSVLFFSFLLLSLIAKSISSVLFPVLDIMEFAQWTSILYMFSILLMIFLYFRISFFSYYVVSYNFSILRALKASWQLSARKWRAMLGLLLLLLVLFFLGVLAFVVGLFVAGPFASFVVVVFFHEWVNERKSLN